MYVYIFAYRYIIPFVISILIGSVQGNVRGSVKGSLRGSVRGRKKKEKEKKMIIKTTMDIDVRNKELSAWFKELGMYGYPYKMSSICVHSRQK